MNNQLKIKNTGFWSYFMFDCKDPRDIEKIVVHSSRKTRDFLTINACDMLTSFPLQNTDIDSFDKLNGLTENYNSLFIDRTTIYYSNIFTYEINKFYRCIMLIRGEKNTTTTIEVYGDNINNLKAFQLNNYITRKFSCRICS